MTTGAMSKEIEDLSHKLFSSILLEQQKINKISGPTEGNEHLVEASLEEYEKLKGRGFYYPYMSSGRGHGPFTELVDGSVKYDLIAGIGPNLLGHSHPLYIKANLESALSDSVMCGNLLSYQEPYKLATALVESVKGSRLEHFWFTGSGSMASDSALKMIWQKKAPHYKVIAFKNSFSGRSIATQDITHTDAYRVGMPKSVHVDHVPHFDEQDPENAAKKTIAALNQLWKDRTDYCAISMELVQGEGGFVHGTPEYYKEVFEWAKKRKLYIWVDEVQTFGRTTELFAFQMFGLEDYVDIVTVGKALQACGVFYTNDLNPKPGLISGTFNGSLVALNAGEKILRYLQEGNFYGEEGRIKDIESKFLTKLKQLKKTSAKGKITFIGGIGTMITFEVGDSSKEITSKFLKALFHNGVIAFIAGYGPHRVRLLLPLSLLDEHIDEIISIIDKTLQEII